MDSAEVKRGKGHKRKALDAGIQNQKVEHAAPGSAEVRDAFSFFFPHGASFFNAVLLTVGFVRGALR